MTAEAKLHVGTCIDQIVRTGDAYRARVRVPDGEWEWRDLPKADAEKLIAWHEQNMRDLTDFMDRQQEAQA